MKCECCGGPIRSHNKIGVCRRNSACKAEHARRAARMFARANRELVNDRQREYRASHRDDPEYVARQNSMKRDYKRRHPEYMRDLVRQRRARIRQVPAEPVDEFALYQRQAGLCGICGLPLIVGEHHLDHIIPTSKGGWHIWFNAQLAHPACNMGKGAKLDEESPQVTEVRRMMRLHPG